MSTSFKLIPFALQKASATTSPNWSSRALLSYRPWVRSFLHNKKFLNKYVPQGSKKAWQGISYHISAAFYGLSPRSLYIANKLTCTSQTLIQYFSILSLLTQSLVHITTRSHKYYILLSWMVKNSIKLNLSSWPSWPIVRTATLRLTSSTLLHTVRYRNL